MAESAEKAVTKELIDEHSRNLDNVLKEVEEVAKKAKDSASHALDTAEKCKAIEEDTLKMIAEFGQNVDQ
eukprot:CAMPEP_0198488682 /NCGR_PEP_ID=MMETSP1462-20131121/932_1 /TAXON_ID=1333877 /ORGANISM="Brandtodinium nutriculum, Strain RCC3387" /LENGTH=69 /DNA_ID=CAMNT_0044217155 /DNA_START=101 /DNA_END=310 /DNA_ORIENTATION=+